MRKERVASELGATDAPEPKARYVRLTLARCSFVLLWLAEAAGGSEEAEAVDVDDGAIVNSDISHTVKYDRKFTKPFPRSVKGLEMDDV